MGQRGTHDKKMTSLAIRGRAQGLLSQKRNVCIDSISEYRYIANKMGWQKGRREIGGLYF